MGKHNSAVRAYNALGGRMGHLIQHSIDVDAYDLRKNLWIKDPPPVSMGTIPFSLWCLSLFNSWLRTRSAQSRSAFRGVEQACNSWKEE